jgi:hypothetical protein
MLGRFVSHLFARRRVLTVAPGEFRIEAGGEVLAAELPIVRLGQDGRMLAVGAEARSAGAAGKTFLVDFGDPEGWHRAGWAFEQALAEYLRFLLVLTDPSWIARPRIELRGTDRFLSVIGPEAPEVFTRALRAAGASGVEVVGAGASRATASGAP